MHGRVNQTQHSNRTQKIPAGNRSRYIRVSAFAGMARAGSSARKISRTELAFHSEKAWWQEFYALALQDYRAS